MVIWGGEEILTTPRLTLRTFRGITDLLNVRSLAVMQRLGMTVDHEAQVENEGEVLDAVIYSITAGSWRELRTTIA